MSAIGITRYNYRHMGSLSGCKKYWKYIFILPLNGGWSWIDPLVRMSALGPSAVICSPFLSKLRNRLT